MTTFEIIVTVAIIAIVVLLIVLLRIVIEGFRGVWQNQNAGVEQLCDIEVNTHHASSVLQDHIAPDVELISSDVPLIREYINNCNQLLDKIIEQDSQGFRWGELSPEQQSEFMYRLTHPIVESPFKPPFEPTAQDAIINKPTDNANKSTNYNGYDPTMIVRGSETTDKES